jgi:hypothetical protein
LGVAASHLSLRALLGPWPLLAWTFFSCGNSSPKAAANTWTVSANALIGRLAACASPHLDPPCEKQQTQISILLDPSWKRKRALAAPPHFSQPWASLGKVTLEPVLWPLQASAIPDTHESQIASSVICTCRCSAARTTREDRLQRGLSKPSSVCTLIHCTAVIEAGKHNSTMGLSSAASRPFENPTARSFAFSFNDSTSLFALPSSLHRPKNPICHAILPWEVSVSLAAMRR